MKKRNMHIEINDIPAAITDSVTLGITDSVIMKTLQRPSLGGLSQSTSVCADPPQPAPLNAPQDARYIGEYSNKMYLAGCGYCASGVCC